MILLANSTPIVCDDRTFHSFLTKRCNKHDLYIEATDQHTSFREIHGFAPSLYMCAKSVGVHCQRTFPFHSGQAI